MGDATRRLERGIQVDSTPQGYLCVRILRPRFGLEQAEEIESLLASRFPDKHPRLILNLAQVEYVDSTAVSLFVRVGLQGDIRLCNMTPTVIGILRKMEIYPLLRVYTNEADARTDL
ncbi:MAG: STAS domain-containing protein [Planctomycetales bacterium]|nr:STAS domain-containing protein [Planctomycetales bacterium]